MSEWRETTAIEIIAPQKGSLISGPFGSNISSKYFVNDGIPVIRGNNLSLDIGLKFIDKDFVFITQNKAEELNTWAIENDIIFTAAGTIGQVGIIKNTYYNKYIYIIIIVGLYLSGLKSILYSLIPQAADWNNINAIVTSIA